jgi:uncharacterized protein YcbK (DUF882 family)
MRALVAALVAAAVPAAGAPARFFVAGDGHLAVRSAHTGEEVHVRYRRADGAYDPGALARLRHVFRSRGDGRDAEVSLRLVEVLSHLQQAAGGGPVTLVSGYRSPAWNEGIRRQGARAASGSLHTEGLAADVRFPRRALRRLWLVLRDLECCGAGYYEADGFLHVDTGQPRFWEPATSRVDENLSGGNARLFARTEFDRYAPGETATLRLHALTEPPVRVAPTARLGPGGPEVALAADLPVRAGCFEVAASGARLRVPALPALVGRVPLVLATCPPRPGRTPERVETNPLEVRGASVP